METFIIVLLMVTMAIVLGGASLWALRIMYLALFGDVIERRRLIKEHWERLDKDERN